MFNAISWGDFITVIVILLIIYYSAIGMLYYRKDIPRILDRFAGASRNSTENEIDSSTKNEVNG
jgi:hypothetical protein